MEKKPNNQIQALNNEEIYNDYLSEENIIDDFISDFHFDEEAQKIIESKTNKLNSMKERENKNEELYKLKKEDMRKKTREKRKENHFKKKKEKFHMLKNLTEEEKDKFYQLERQKIKDQEANLISGLQSNFHIIFDLEYVNLMKYKEMKSVVTQVSFCYGLNRRVKSPFNYHLCGYKDEIKFEFERMGSKFWHVNFDEKFFYENEEFFNKYKERIIYLTPDSPYVLEDIDNDSVFIIGGFVDKPVSKNRSLFKANSLNIKTGKLPLGEHLEDIRNTVLNINTVMEIIANFMETKNWKDSIEKVLPKRMI